MNISASVLRLGRWTNRSAETIDREIDEELDFHIECQTRDLIESGMNPEQAAKEASRMFGGREKIRRECQAIGYGQNVWLIIVLCCGILVSLAAAGWMGYLLNLAHLKNQQMLALVHTLQPAPVEKHDLSGAVQDAKGQPVSGAKVLLIFKSWPNGQYHQNSFVQTSDEAGRFRFPELYSPTMQNAFLVTVLAEGLAMQSEYVLYKANARVKTFRIKLKPAIEKTFIVHDNSGKPMSEAFVFPSLRKPARGSEEFMMYDQSGADAGYRTDAEGRVKMGLFAPGDTVQLGVVDGEKIDFVVNKSAEQKLGAGMSLVSAANNTGVRGSVSDASGKPVVDARILLIHKSWPSGRFRQQPLETKTNDDGSFSFPAENQHDQKEAFLVTVVKDGLAFQSVYVTKKAGEAVDPFEFQMSDAISKTFLFRDSTGQPLANTVVALSGRTDVNSRKHLIYGASFPAVSYKTNAEGKVALNFFAVGDKALLHAETGKGSDEIEVTIDANPEQPADVKTK